ncbi:MAG: hypothetical protein LBU65_14370 [Planctomycetaceae bacterium]|jgi:hypothetical protein|nr:hypothetical protein [Planctomycetaceae bacterium]
MLPNESKYAIVTKDQTVIKIPLYAMNLYPTMLVLREVIDAVSASPSDLDVANEHFPVQSAGILYE